MTTIDDINDIALKPYQKHRQLSMREAEMLSLELVTLLCESHCQNESTLKYLARFLTPEQYHDLLDERNLNKKCGYPMCDQSPERIKDPFAGNDTTRRFLWENNPYAYLSSFCSKFHFKCSQFYQMQLSEDALFTRTGIHLYDCHTDNVHSKVHDENFKVTLLEELIREKASEEDIKSLIASLKNLGLQNPGEEDQGQLETDISKWLSEIKIVENEEPSTLGDLIKEE